jgi:ATP-dependent exoDNAse (exonuclease V) beta subunit
VTNPIDLTLASAGTGKTYALVEAACAALDMGFPPEKLIAVTFTVKAAGELVERVRKRLVSAGRAIDAERVLVARFGTIHAVCSDILREFAIDAGRSPLADVLSPEAARKAFRRAADRAISQRANLVQPIVERFRYTVRSRPLRRIDWRDIVRDIAAAARENGLTPQELRASEARSWEMLRSVLPTPNTDSVVLDGALAAAMAAALPLLKGGGHSGNDTAKCVEDISNLLPTAQDKPEDLTWADWARLSKLKPNASARIVVSSVTAAAQAHLGHPRLHDDISKFIQSVFACAADAIEDYQTWKAGRGLVDFIDMEVEALQLLRMEHIRAAIADRIDYMLVDEFQDTSPMQLAIFKELASLVQRSFWVGDPKQAIYGFRGASPDIIAREATTLAQASGAALHPPLAGSQRSRSGLVHFFDATFIPAFGTLGLRPEQVAMGCAAREDARGQPLPLVVTVMPCQRVDEVPAALAAAVKGMLDDAANFPVVPKGITVPRPLQPGDIAILCRMTEQCTAIATALDAAGMKVAMEQPGLLASAEVAAALAALRWVVFSDDHLALAELAHFMGGGQDSTPWLDAVLRKQFDVLQAHVAGSTLLTGIREQLLHLTPLEALDAAIAAAGIGDYAAALGDAGTRLSNLDALRTLASAYTDEAAKIEAPATPAGFLAWLDQGGHSKPPSPDGDAITVMTCHGAKGLEWPVVVMGSLGTALSARPFDSVSVETDPSRDGGPMSGRWLRFWPLPYGEQQRGTGLDTAWLNTPIADGLKARNRAEEVRLLYVGLTRARDYLVLAARLKSGALEVDALDLLVDEQGQRVITLPIAAGQQLKAGGVAFDVTFRTAQPGVPVHRVSSVQHIAPRTGPVSHPPLRLRPSAAFGITAPPAFNEIRIGDRIPLNGRPDIGLLGNAVHAFLAADPGQGDNGPRIAMAASCLANWGVGGAVDPAALVTASTKLWAWISSRWPGSLVHREVPVAGRVGLQRVNGRIDLLVEDAICWGLLDHKTYPGGHDRWPGELQSYVPQLAAYEALCREAGAPAVSRFVHLPIAGVVLELV